MNDTLETLAGRLKKWLDGLAGPEGEGKTMRINPREARAMLQLINDIRENND